MEIEPAGKALDFKTSALPINTLARKDLRYANDDY
jgi:hypothetical protein